MVSAQSVFVALAGADTRKTRDGRCRTAHRSPVIGAAAALTVALCVIAGCGGATEITSDSVATNEEPLVSRASTTDAMASLPVATDVDVDEGVISVNEGATGGGSEEWAPSGINRITLSSEVGVVGSVVSVDEVPSGEWGMGYLSGVLKVEQSMFGEVAVGDLVEFTQLNPRDVPTSVGGLPAEVPSDDRYGAMFDLGSRLLMLLGTMSRSGPDGVNNVLVPSHGYQSTWMINDDIAVSVDPQRTVPLAPLVERITAEREAPLTQDSDPQLHLRDRATVRNPLATEFEAPPATTVALSPPESGQLPASVETADSFTLDGPAGHSNFRVVVGRTNTGGYAIALHDGFGQIATNGAPDLNVLAPMSGTVLFDGENVAVAGFGDPHVDPAAIEVTTDTGQTPAFTIGVWQVDQRPVVLVVVPTGVTTVTVTGFFAAPTVWTLPVAP